MYSHCTTGGWILGNTIDGTQAEFVLIPHADTSLYPIPEGVDTAIEAVGIPATFELSEQIVAAGGIIANIGVHGVPDRCQAADHPPFQA